MRHNARMMRKRGAPGRVEIVCIGDSITYGTSGRPGLSAGSVGWVEQLATAIAGGTLPGGGFRGLWCGHEWTRRGRWTQAIPADPFDVAPFGQGFFSSGTEVDKLTWTKPDSLTVAGFDLYWFHMRGTGDWQYRVDGRSWTHSRACAANADNRLHRLSVAEPVATKVEVRGHDGKGCCVAPIAGIGVYADRPAGGGAAPRSLAAAGHAADRPRPARLEREQSWRCARHARRAHSSAERPEAHDPARRQQTAAVEDDLCLAGAR